jgi:hypothetical protein
MTCSFVGKSMGRAVVDAVQFSALDPDVGVEYPKQFNGAEKGPATTALALAKFEQVP